MKELSPLYASIIIRSKDRLPELKNLVQTCLGQRYPCFDMVIVDSTEGVTDAELRHHCGVDDDSRVSVIRTPPRGCSAAANEGVAASRGEVVVFVDDDDVPVGEDWLAAHMRNYDDPACLGVQGRMNYEGDDARNRLKEGAEQWMLRFNFFKDAQWIQPVLTRVIGIDFLMGGNASLRRTAYFRGDGWDEFLPYHNECSLFLRLKKTMSADEYLVYDPDALMRIRRNVPGGADLRNDVDVKRLIDTYAKHYLWTAAPLYPGRFYGLFPFFALNFVRWCGRASVQYVQGKEGAEGRSRESSRHLWRFYGIVSLLRHLVTRPTQRRVPRHMVRPPH